MASNCAQNNVERPLKSLRNDRFALVTFVSRTQRAANLYWLDYEGVRVKYTTLQPGDVFPILTYETHPWIFRDSVTGAPLVANNTDNVYFPETWDGEGQTLVYIDIPVYKLRDICIDDIRKKYSPDEISRMDIPRALVPEILHRDKTPYKVHMTF